MSRRVQGGLVIHEFQRDTFISMVWTKADPETGEPVYYHGVRMDGETLRKERTTHRKARIDHFDAVDMYLDSVAIGEA